MLYSARRRLLHPLSKETVYYFFIGSGARLWHFFPLRFDKLCGGSQDARGKWLSSESQREKEPREERKHTHALTSPMFEVREIPVYNSLFFPLLLPREKQRDCLLSSPYCFSSNKGERSCSQQKVRAESGKEGDQVNPLSKQVSF